MKKLSYSFIALLALLFICSVSLKAQQVVWLDEFDNGAGQWAQGWINTGGGANVTFSIDNTGKLSGANSYLADIVTATSTTYNIQRIKDCPLLAGNIYTLSFKAVSNKDDASINVLFELAGDPYTKRLNETPIITTTPQVFTYTMSATENVPTNQVKLHYGGTQNDGAKIWVDSVIVTQQPDPALVSSWGKTNRGTAWPILNTSTTASGDAGLGNGAQPTGWSTIRGGFATLEATTSQAVVVSGQMELVGGGCDNAYTHLRYALTFQDSIKLVGQYADTARWVTTGTTEKGHYGYEFTPRTGSGTMANGSNGVGTVWTVPNSLGWNSTYSGQVPLIAVKQAPINAVMVAGTYNWAMSVQPLGDGSNEVRWYMIEQNNKYWFGGTVIDTSMVTTKFNGVCFGFNNDLEATQVNLKLVKAELGAPIEVPAAPWQAFYVNQWGKTNRGTAWPVLNDSTYLDGDASLGNGAPPTGWSTIRGGFLDVVQATTEKAIIVTGQLEFVGGGCDNAYTHLRYALTYQDSIKLVGQYADTARWVTTGTTEKGHFGYEFTPRTGSGTMANGSNGVGTVWTVPNSLGWNSTYSGQVPLTAVKQAPTNAVMVAGLYNWAISVRPLGDGSNEVRWYMIEKDNKYWFGGITIDTYETSSKFNGVCFGFNNDLEATQVNLYEVKVDIGDPIVIPEAPWEAYYVTDWGFSGGNLGGWNLIPGEFDGDVTIGGTAAPTGLSAVRGGIETYVLSAEKDRALIITGQIELVGGGFEDLASLRYGLFYSDSAGVTQQDPALDSNWVWTGTDRAHSGYLFVPPSGTNVANWSGVTGTWGGITDGTWWDISNSNSMALGAQLQTPADAVAGPGIFDFAISISATESGNLVRSMLSSPHNNYSWESSAIVTATTDKINCVAFAIDNSTTTALNLYEIKVDRGADIVTAIKTEDRTQLNQVPTVYSLKQNYPNPFNPTTMIEFSLPQSSEVNLVVYDLSGRVVAELAKGKFEAGNHKINFDARGLASGVYFVRLKAGDFVSVNKAMLLK